MTKETAITEPSSAGKRFCDVNKSIWSEAINVNIKQREPVCCITATRCNGHI